jgi:hypothetical protein
MGSKYLEIMMMENGMRTAMNTVASDAEARNQTASTALQIRRAEPRFYQDQPQPETTSRRRTLPGTLWEASDWPLTRKATQPWLFYFKSAPADPSVTPLLTSDTIAPE